MYIARQKQTHRYREQASGYQWGDGRGEGKHRGRGIRDTNYYVFLLTLNTIDSTEGRIVGPFESNYQAYIFMIHFRNQMFSSTANMLQPI